MNIHNTKISFIGLGKGILFCCSASLILSGLLTLVTIGFALLNSPYENSLGSGILFMLIWTFIAVIITFIAAIILGIPVTAILIKTGIDNEWISGIIGVILVFLIIYYLDSNYPSALIYYVYAFCSAFGFMFGYKKS